MYRVGGHICLRFPRYSDMYVLHIYISVCLQFVGGYIIIFLLTNLPYSPDISQIWIDFTMSLNRLVKSQTLKSQYWWWWWWRYVNIISPTTHSQVKSAAMYLHHPYNLIENPSSCSKKEMRNIKSNLRTF